VTPEDLYLQAVVNRHRLPAPDPAAHHIRRRLEPLLQSWAGAHLESVTLSGSQAKGSALRDGDVDLFLSLAPDTPSPLAVLHSSLAARFCDYLP